MLLLLKACLKIVGNQDLNLRLFLKMEWRKVTNSLDDFLCFNFIDEPLYEFRKLRSTEKFCLDNGQGYFPDQSNGFSQGEIKTASLRLLLEEPYVSRPKLAYRFTFFSHLLEFILFVFKKIGAMEEIRVASAANLSQLNLFQATSYIWYTGCRNKNELKHK